jgi:uncharacterized protein (DUF433 family)
MHVAMDEITRDVRKAVAAAKERTPDEIGQIEQHRNVAENAHVLAGTRIPTKAVWLFHAAGYEPEQIQREFPRLTARDIEAAVEFESSRAS